MKNVIKIVAIIVVAVAILQCKDKEDSNPKETILSGTTSILVDETLLPIIEDQVAVFESDYPAKINIVSRSEAEAIQALVKDSAQVVILSRKLTADEKRIFDNKKITPKVTMFATDAIALVVNRNSADTLVDLEEILKFMKGERNATDIKGLVFDDPNSSTMRYISDLAGVKSTPTDGIYSFKTNEDVIEFVSENNNMIGVVGLNWLSQPSEQVQKIRDKILIVSVKGEKSTDYYYPSQNNLAERKYPLARDLFIIDVQGYSGLGHGFASFIAGERGQRLVLKSGLLPVRIPGRKIVTRNKIEMKNNK